MRGGSAPPPTCPISDSWRTASLDIRRALELDPSDAEANRIMAVFELLKDNFDRRTLMRRAMGAQSV